MQLSFRWYGPDDPVSLENIRQIPGMNGIVTSLHDIAPGEVWSEGAIAARVQMVQNHGMEIRVIESVPVHEDIKMGKPTREKYVENYQETLRNLARCGIHTVCYNFMPLFDWLRTTLTLRLSDGSTTLAYDDAMVDEDALLGGRLRLPAWDLDANRDKLRQMHAYYQAMSSEQLWENLGYFVENVMPVARELGIKMTIHPDDPPWSVVGIPRIIKNRDDLLRLVSLYDHEANGICFCSGSFGSSDENNLPLMMREFGEMGRIHFVHLRNVLRTGHHSFYESGHRSQDGSVDMYALMKVMHELGYNGPMRPDHGRMVWGETGNAGYGLFDRAMGATYFNGLWEAILKA